MPSNYSTDEECSESDYSESDIYPKQAKGEPCAECDATVAIDHEICQAEISLIFLRQRRLLLLGNMNNVHDPLVSRLPVEVVARIFAHFLPVNVDMRYSPICPDDVPLWETPTTPLVLGAVCKTWRSVVWSTPKLWSSISVNIYHSRDRLVDIVAEWLGRSGRLPLYIHLYASPVCQAHRRSSWTTDCSSPPRGSEPYIVKLIDMINGYSRRWSYLYLSLPRAYMEQVHFMNGEVEMLNTLNLEAISKCATKAPTNDREFGKDLKVDQIPNLRNLCARGFYFHQLDINFYSLTCVEAAKIPAGTCLQLLEAAPLLTHCTFWDVTFFPNNYKHEPIRHRSLTFLYAKGCWAKDVLGNTNMPALEHLATSAYRSDEFDHIQGFLERSACSLKSFGLELHVPIGYKTERLMLLVKEIMPLSLETLALDFECSKYYTQWDASVNREIQKAMTDDADSRFLPNLKTLRIVVRLFPWNCLLTLSCPADTVSPIFRSLPKRERYFYIFTLFNCALDMTYLPDLDIQKNVPLFISSNFGDSPSRKHELSSSFVEFLRWVPSQVQSLSPLIFRLGEVWDLGIYLTDIPRN